MTQAPASPEAVAACKAALRGLDLDDNPATVRQKSRDFFWYSPVLKARLEAVCADFVVAPRDAGEVAQALAAAHAHGVPVTVRGAGTGNYGQAMPLAGGMVLHLKHLTEVLEIAPGRVKAQAGAIIADIDRATRAHSGQELRMHPSTYHTASIGGFVAGGSGGVGSIRWGGLRDAGNILSLTLTTCEAEPRTLTLTGDAIHQASHAYGVNGVITEVEMALAPAYDWVDVILGFDGWGAANGCALTLAHQDGVWLKELATIAAPIGQRYFRRHAPFFGPADNLVVAVVAPHSLEALLTAAARDPAARLLFRGDRDRDRARDGGLPPAYELTWNHTTLRALRVDPAMTYLQVLYAEPTLQGVVAMAEAFGDEVPGHVEYIRFDGRIRAAGLPLLRYTDEARLDAIVAAHEAAGHTVFNPHRYTLEEGGMKAPDPAQLRFKRETDPKGLMNPGKMIAWDDPDHDFGAGKIYLFPGMSGG
jgi:FAD/FMN-containing dehydrogenase